MGLLLWIWQLCMYRATAGGMKGKDKVMYNELYSYRLHGTQVQCNSVGTTECSGRSIVLTPVAHDVYDHLNQNIIILPWTV